MKQYNLSYVFGWVIEAKWGVSSTFGILASILGIEGSWFSKFEGPLWAKIEAHIPKVELTPHLAQSPNQIAQIVLFHFDIFIGYSMNPMNLCVKDLFSNDDGNEHL